MSVTNGKIYQKKIGSIIYSLEFFGDNKYIISKCDEIKDINNTENPEACYIEKVAEFNNKEDAMKYLENLTKRSKINLSVNSGQVEK